MEKWHRSVLVKESLHWLNVRPTATYVDCTFGEGGHSEALLDLGASVVAFDRDNEALLRYREQGRSRQDRGLTLRHARFSRIHNWLGENSADGALMDLGVSTRQLLEGKRGFSFSSPGPLDMRMDTSETSLAEVLSHIRAEDLASELERTTDMRKALPLARSLLESFRRGEIATTTDLASIIGERHGKRHPATVLFLALRMLVNEELEEIESGIPEVLRVLKPGARLVVITFHSTEDRLVKRILRRLAGKCVCERGQSICLCPKEKTVEILLKKPLVPTREEMRENPRARSAKMRCVEKIPAAK